VIERKRNRVLVIERARERESGRNSDRKKESPEERVIERKRVKKKE